MLLCMISCNVTQSSFQRFMNMMCGSDCLLQFVTGTSRGSLSVAHRKVSACSPGVVVCFRQSYCFVQAGLLPVSARAVACCRQSCCLLATAVEVRLLLPHALHQQHTLPCITLMCAVPLIRQGLLPLTLCPGPLVQKCPFCSITRPKRADALAQYIHLLELLLKLLLNPALKLPLKLALKLPAGLQSAMETATAAS